MIRSNLTILKSDIQSALNMIFANSHDFDAVAQVDPYTNSIHITLNINYNGQTPVSMKLYHVYKDRNIMIINPFNNLIAKSFIVRDMKNDNIMNVFGEIFSYESFCNVRETIDAISREKIELMSMTQNYMLENFKITSFLKFGKQSTLYLYINNAVVHTDRKKDIVHIKSYNKSSKFTVNYTNQLDRIKIVDEVRKQLNI